MFGKLVRLLPRGLLVRLYKMIPDGMFKNWLVYHSQTRFLVAVQGVLTNRCGQVLLLKHTYRRQPWGVPGGWMEREQPEIALARELYEETGLSCRITGLVKAVYLPDPTRVDLIYRGEVDDGGTFTPSSEISDILFCEPGKWPQGLPMGQQRLIMDVLQTGNDQNESNHGG